MYNKYVIMSSEHIPLRVINIYHIPTVRRSRKCYYI